MKRGFFRFFLVALAGALALASSAWAQRRPYIGYTYPAGGQQGTTVQLKLGGQDLDDVNAVLVSGTGVTGRVVEFQRRLNNQEMQLLREQLRELKRTLPAAKSAKAPVPVDPGTQQLIAKVEKRLADWVQQPACASIASLVYVELTISPDAEPGTRELRLASHRGVTNPLVFQIGQLLEFGRPAMRTATIQVLGKEHLALRKRAGNEIETPISVPCTVNGQIASGEVNRYRFSASKGQRLVISTQARQLIPFVADAVPGWFQPVLVLYDGQGREVAYADDFRFKPDPVIFHAVSQDGEYVVEIQDSLYRGREDFVYRISIGEFPFITNLFPLGGQVGVAASPRMGGINCADADLMMPDNRRPGLQYLAANRLGVSSNRVPFALDPLPDEFDRESNDTEATAQPIQFPAVVNGRIDRSDDWDVYQFTGRANQMVAIEVQARRLESPLDSVIKLTDANGRVLAFNDDREDVTAGLNTHHADSYLVAKLPASGAYRIHIGDTARMGGEEYGYRLRVSAPQPDFELRVVPSSISIPTNGTAAVTVYAVRKDGFTGPIRLTLKDPPEGVTATPVTITANQTEVRFTLRGPRQTNRQPFRLSIVGSSKLAEQEIAREAVAAEDRMQAFLWRHLLPVSELQAVVADRNYQPPPRRVPPARITAPVTPAVMAQAAVQAVAASTAAAPTTTTNEPVKPKFTKQQIAGRLRQLKMLYEEGLLADPFYATKVAECDASQ